MRNALDWFGAVGVLLLYGGVAVEFGPGWACITLGAPAVALYVYLELFARKRRP